MATTPLPLVTPAHGLIFRAFCDWLQTGGDLKRVVRTWRVWQGANSEDALADSPSMLPLVRVTPEMGPMGWQTITGHVDSPMDLVVETEVAGSLAEDSVKLWEAIRLRVGAWNYTAIGVWDLTPTAPAQVVNDSDVTTARGRFRLDISVVG